MNFRLFVLVGSMAATALSAVAEPNNGVTQAPAAANTANADASVSAPPEVVDGYLKLGFDRLASYKFVAPVFDPAANPNVVPPTGEEQIPVDVKGWNGKKAILTGFMMPMKMKDGLVTEFLLVKDPMVCCYGAVPAMNEWVVVKMTQGIKPLLDQPVAYYGVMKVGATFDSGFLTGIYELAGEKAEPLPH